MTTKNELKLSQRKPRMHMLRVDESAITGATASQDPGLLEASTINEVRLTRNGDGDYSIAMATAFARAPIVMVTANVPDAICYAESITTTGFDVKITTNDGGSAKAADFHCVIIGFDAADLV